MEVKIKKLLAEAVIPSYAKPGDAAMDLTATSIIYDEHGNVSYGTGLAFEIPEGYVGLLFPRSSNSKQDLLLSNSVGVVDSGYRGEVLFKFKPALFFASDEYGESSVSDDFDYTVAPYGLGTGSEEWGFTAYEVGDRIGQILIMPYPKVTFREVAELSETVRGDGGYGSSGK